MQAVFYAQMASGPTASPLTGSAFLYAKSVEVHFTPEQEAQIVQAARVTGTDAARLVQHIAMRFADDANFRAGVLEAKEYADRGEFIEEDEMDRRFEEMLRS